MNELSISDIISGNSAVKVIRTDSAFNLQFMGDFDLENPSEFFDPYFNNVHSEIIRNKQRNIDIITKELNFINSSSIKCIVKWIVNIQRLQPHERYTLTFRTNKDILWQKLSFEALQFFALDTVKVLPG